MGLHKNLLVAAAGAATASVVAGLGACGWLRKAAVVVTSGALRVGDAVKTQVQTVVDEANDVVAEARLQARIDAAVEERMAELESKVRAEVKDEYGVAPLAETSTAKAK